MNTHNLLQCILSRKKERYHNFHRKFMKIVISIALKIAVYFMGVFTCITYPYLVFIRVSSAVIVYAVVRGICCC